MGIYNNTIKEEGTFEAVIVDVKIVEPRYDYSKNDDSKDIALVFRIKGYEEEDTYAFWQSEISSREASSFYKGMQNFEITVNKLEKIGWKYDTNFSSEKIKTLLGTNVSLNIVEKEYYEKKHYLVVKIERSKEYIKGRRSFASKNKFNFYKEEGEKTYTFEEYIKVLNLLLEDNKEEDDQ